MLSLLLSLLQPAAAAPVEPGIFDLNLKLTQGKVTEVVIGQTTGSFASARECVQTKAQTLVFPEGVGDTSFAVRFELKSTESATMTIKRTFSVPQDTTVDVQNALMTVIGSFSEHVTGCIGTSTVEKSAGAQAASATGCSEEATKILDNKDYFSECMAIVEKSHAGADRSRESCLRVAGLEELVRSHSGLCGCGDVKGLVYKGTQGCKER